MNQWEKKEVSAYNLKLEYIIEKIINAITHPGELFTDGECMDMVWEILEDKDYDLDIIQKTKESFYNSTDKKTYLKDYL